MERKQSCRQEILPFEKQNGSGADIDFSRLDSQTESMLEVINGMYSKSSDRKWSTRNGFMHCDPEHYDTTSTRTNANPIMPTTRVDLLRRQRRDKKELLDSQTAIVKDRESDAKPSRNIGNSKLLQFEDDGKLLSLDSMKPSPLPSTSLNSAQNCPRTNSSNVQLQDQRQRPVSAKSRPNSNKKFLQKYNL